MTRFFTSTAVLISTVFLGLTACNNSVNKKTDNSTPTDSTEKKKKMMSVQDSIEYLYPSLWVYGGPPEQKDYQRQILDRWYDFRFTIKSSLCTVAPDKDTEAHNKKTDSVMTARLGKDWYKRFEKSVDSLYAIDSLAIAIAQADSYIHNFDTTTEKHNDKYNYYPNLRYTSHATNDDNIKIVTIEGYGVAYRQVGDLSYLRATVDLKKKKVINIDKTAFSLW